MGVKRSGFESMLHFCPVAGNQIMENSNTLEKDKSCASMCVFKCVHDRMYEEQ